MNEQELRDLKKRVEILEDLLLPDGGGGPTAIEKSFDHLKGKIDDLEGRIVTKDDLDKLKEDIDRTKRVIGFIVSEASALSRPMDSMEKMLREKVGKKNPRTKYMEGD